MITKIAEEWIFRDGVQGISSKKLFDHMSKKHNLDPQLYTPEQDRFNYVASAIPSYLRGEQARRLKRFKGIGTEEMEQHRKAILDSPEAKAGKPLVLMGKKLYDNNPEVLGHELGHLSRLQGRPRFSKMLMAARMASIPASVAGVSMPYWIKNKPLGIALGLGMQLPLAATLHDEYQASSRSRDALKELGHTERPKSLDRAWLTYALPSMALGAVQLAANEFTRRVLR